MFKKIYISAEKLDKPNELYDFSYLKDEPMEWIWNHAMKVWHPYDGKIYDVAVLEIFLFKSYLKEQWYKDEQIEVLHNNSLFTFNEKLYKIQNEKVIELDTDNVWFFSLRWSDLNFPFFYILKKIVEKKWGKFMRTNEFHSYVYWKWKFYSLYQLYSYREDILWDIVVPYNITWNNIEVFVEFLRTNLSRYIVAKRDFSCAGEWVYVVDLDNYTEEQKNKFHISIDDKGYFTRTSYILPYYHFKEEYRFYFTKQNGKIEIFSFKRKRVLSTLDDAVKSENFRYFKNIKIKWEYISKQEYKNYEKAFAYAYSTLEKLEYDTWTFECWETEDGRIIFFEVNPMSAAICFEWEDEENMNNFYKKLFSSFL